MKHNYVPPLIPFIVLGLLWKFVTSAKLWTAYILPPPERVWETFLIMIQNGQLVEHAALSLMRVFIGFSCAFLLAAFLVTLSLLLPFFRKMNHGLLVFIQHIPPLSLIPLLVLWFGIGETPKFLIIILATFFPVSYTHLTLPTIA